MLLLFQKSFLSQMNLWKKDANSQLFERKYFTVNPFGKEHLIRQTLSEAENSHYPHRSFLMSEDLCSGLC